MLEKKNIEIANVFLFDDVNASSFVSSFPSSSRFIKKTSGKFRIENGVLTSRIDATDVTDWN